MAAQKKTVPTADELAAAAALEDADKLADEAEFASSMSDLPPVHVVTDPGVPPPPEPVRAPRKRFRVETGMNWRSAPGSSWSYIDPGTVVSWEPHEVEYALGQGVRLIPLDE